MAAQERLDLAVPEIELPHRVPMSMGTLSCARRGAAHRWRSSQATVGERFEIFFRLTGPSDARSSCLTIPVASLTLSDACPMRVCGRRLALRHRHPSSRCHYCSLAGWLDQLPEGGVRQLFEHLAAHGTVTENEAALMLGGARGLRRFTLEFEALAQKAPWGVRIDVVAGVKRYVREGK